MKFMKFSLLFVLFSNVYCTPFRARPNPGMQCGRVSDNTLMRIVGGDQASGESWPWIVSIELFKPTSKNDTKPNICGGVLLLSDWVLTAAHCLDDESQPMKFPKTPLKSWIVTAGMKDRNSTVERITRWQKRGVKKFYHHPDFQDFQTLTKSTIHDIALLQLDRPIELNSHIRPICLPSKKSYDASNNKKDACFSAGWGTTSEKKSNYSSYLRQVQLKMIKTWTCRFRYGSAVNTQGHLCAGDMQHGSKDSCKGDSGGPLACVLNDGTWNILGVVSWGEGCGRKGIPGIYINVFRYMSWIVSILIHHSPYETLQTQTLLFGGSKSSSSPTGSSLARRINMSLPYAAYTHPA